jgi:hypothetical protein
MTGRGTAPVPRTRNRSAANVTPGDNMETNLRSACKCELRIPATRNPFPGFRAAAGGALFLTCLVCSMYTSGHGRELLAPSVQDVMKEKQNE